MPTPYIQPNDNSPTFEPGNLAQMSNYIETEVGHEGVNLALQIANVLQTTLDIENLIQIFSNESSPLIPHDSICYENHHQNIEIQHGKRAKHSCTYQLVAADNSLGQLTLTRKKKFTISETTLLEYLLCSLVYPLRNAILYKNAVTAALKDPLTGANNRSAMNTAIIREIEMAKRHNTPLCLIALDIDKFKNINDTYGHAAGDSVIKGIAKKINTCIRSSDIFCRYGGEEFLVLLSNTDREGAMLLAERIRTSIAVDKCIFNGTEIPVTASLGIACFDNSDNSETLFEKADAALYRAKSDGRNRTKIFDDLK
ncbi:MAG: GGDEF domain-containing protein [Gammaproteobacteria bacterium]